MRDLPDYQDQAENIDRRVNTHALRELILLLSSPDETAVSVCVFERQREKKERELVVDAEK